MNRTPNDPERDAWLSEALRHAPDAQRLPPAELSSAILREARLAVDARRAGSAPKSPGRGRLAAAWAWLGRPPVAAGFASVMVAVLVGLLWWDRPIDEGLRAPASPHLARDRAAAPAGELERSPTPSAMPAAKSAPTPPSPSEPATAAAPRDRAVAREPATPSPGTAPTVRAESPAPFRDEGPSAAAPLAEPASKSAAARRDADSTAAADTAVAAEAQAGGRSAAHHESANASRGALASNAAKAAAPGATPLAEALASIDAEPQRWSGRRDGGARQPMVAALARWLHRLDDATAGRWRDVAVAASAADRDTAGASALDLYRDAALLWTLQIDTSGVRLTPANADTAPQRATLTPENTEALRRELAAAAP